MGATPQTKAGGRVSPSFLSFAPRYALAPTASTKAPPGVRSERPAAFRARDGALLLPRKFLLRDVRPLGQAAQAP